MGFGHHKSCNFPGSFCTCPEGYWPERIITVVLQRAFNSKKETLGIITIGGHEHQPIFTLERPWQDNRPFVSRIKADSYVCYEYSSDKFPGVYSVSRVKDRSSILIHCGNKVEDSSGCILIGLGYYNAEGKIKISQSRDALKLFKSIIGPNSFILEIKDVGAVPDLDYLT